MNQEQIKMGMKISKKISKKNNKNNKHGTLKENQELLDQFGVPENSEFRDDMLDILAAYPNHMFMKKFNKWYSSSPKIYLNKSKYMLDFYNYCIKKFKSINPNYNYKIKYHKIILDKPYEESPNNPKILYDDPNNPTEDKTNLLERGSKLLKKIFPKKEEIKELPERDVKLPEFKTLQESKSKIINSDYLKDLNDLYKEENKKEEENKEEEKEVPKEEKKAEEAEENKLEKQVVTNKEIIDELKNGLGSKFNEKYEHYMNMLIVFRTIVELKSVNQFNKWLDDNPDIFYDNKAKDEVIYKFFDVCLNKLKDLGLNPILDKGNGHITINNDTTAPKIKSKPNLEAPATPTIPKKEEKEVPKEEEKKAEPETKPEVKLTKSIKDLINDYQKQRPNLFAGSIRKDMFNNLLNIIIHDGNYSKLLTEIRKKHEYYEKHPKITIAAIQKLMNETLLKDPNIQFDLFGKQLDNYVKMKFPEEFEKGDKLPIDEETFKNDLKLLIKENISLAKFHQITIERAVNKEFSRYGFPIVSISGDNNSTINIGKYTAFENNMRERSKGKIDTNPSNSKTFFSYDIHEIYHIIEKGLEIKLSTEAKNDIESIVRMETSNLINHLNISHGSSNIQNIIEKIEKYISSRMKDKSKSFKFTESNRYRLKELLKRFLNTRNNGQK